MSCFTILTHLRPHGPRPKGPWAQAHGPWAPGPARGRVVLREPPLEIPPLELKMAWSPLLQHNPANKWLRNLINETAQELDGGA